MEQTMGFAGDSRRRQQAVLKLVLPVLVSLLALTPPAAFLPISIAAS